MAKRKNQFESHLQSWAKENNIEELVQDPDIFVVVDKYNKPIYSKRIPKDGINKLTGEKKKKVEEIINKLPYDHPYFTVNFDKKNNIFLIKKKTPIQSVLNVWAVVMIVWALYRWHFQTSLPIWVDELIAKPLVFLLPVFWYIKKVEKQSFIKGVSLDKPLTLNSAITGLIIGVIFFSTGFISFYLKDSTISFSKIFSSAQMPLLFLIIIAFATSFSEEVLTRGFLLKRLYEDSKNVYTSALYTSILFFFMHIPILFTNANIVGSMLLQVMFTDILFSLAVSFLYIEKRNLYLAILIHALYNISIYLFSAG